MEAITRLVTESLVRHGFDRPLDYRRLHWSRWFRCDSHHSLLHVPSKPGVFAIAEEIMNGMGNSPGHTENREGHDFSRAAKPAQNLPVLAAEGLDGGKVTFHPSPARRMLAVTKFFEDDDMAFVLDRMLASQNPMRARLASGRYFVRFVVIEDSSQRRSIWDALNQWMASSAELASGIGSHFASSLELTPQTEYVSANDAQATLFEDVPNHGSNEAHVATGASPVPPAQSAAPSKLAGFTASDRTATAPQLDSGAATNIHCPSPFPAGF